MPNINDIFSTQDKEKTTAQVIAAELIEMCNNSAKQIVYAHQEPFNKLWKRTEELGVDPQDVLDALGEKGPQMFRLASDLVTFILGGYGNEKITDLDISEYSPPYSYSIIDGKIKLNK